MHHICLPKIVKMLKSFDKRTQMYALCRRNAPANSFDHFETFLYMYAYTKALTK